MVAPTILPGRAFAQIEPRSRLLFSWRARDMTLSTIERVAGTFARASDGGLVQARGSQTWFDADGLRLAGPHSDDLARFEIVLDENGVYVPALRLEDARTNTWTRSSEFDDGVYTLTRATIDADDVVAPDGRTTAEKLVEDGSTDTHRVARASGTVTASTTQAVSVFAKAAGRDFLAITTNYTTVRTTWFNLSTGAVGTSDASHTASIEDVGNGWYRCKVIVASESSTGASIELYIADADNNLSYTGNSSDGIYLWLADPGVDVPFPSSPIPTVASTVTRAAESLFFSYKPVPQTHTAYVRFIERGSIAGADGLSIMGIVDAGNSDPRFFIEETGGFYRAVHDNGPTQVNSTVAVAPSDGDMVELRAVLNSDGSVQMGQSVNGDAETTGAVSSAAALAAAWSDERIYLNSRGTSKTGFGSFLDLKVAAGVQTMPFMREIL